MTDLVYYEQPLNERIRTFLRLEHLFCQTDYTLRGFSVWDSRASLVGLVDTLEVLSRSDFKTELLKEIERQSSKLQALQNVAGVDTQQLNSVLMQLRETEDLLHDLSGQIGQNLRETELFNTLKQRQTIAGGSCPIDLPALHLWLQQPAESRIELLEQWNASLNIVRKPIALLLGMIREAADPQTQLAPQGFFQQSLDTNNPVQLVRAGIEVSKSYYAEISAGKHRMTIRFLEPHEGRSPKQLQETVEFELTYCAI